jgi:hypothetical protein
MGGGGRPGGRRMPEERNEAGSRGPTPSRWAVRAAEPQLPPAPILSCLVENGGHRSTHGCLGYCGPDAYDAMTDEERKALGERCRPHDEEFFGTGKVRDVAFLQHRVGAHIRPGPDGPLVTEGPFAGTKEVVGSHFMIEAHSLEQAIEIASLHPAARIGRGEGFSMEVRPVQMVW